MTRRNVPLIAWLIVCYAFLYAPIGFLVALSFNASRLVTAWDGFSLRWYATLWHDQTLISAALLSLRIAATSATLALIVGTLAGYALARFGRFPSRAALAATLAAPLVLPEVITGLSLLLLFVALEQGIGWPAGRGAGTVTLAHASVSVAYVTVVVRARLAGTPADLEDAALDLYAPPWKAFALVTLPLMAPALISGWLLSFTLSLDDVVVASFTSGPGASTLPMVVFSSIKLGPTPELYALAAAIVAVVAAILLGVSWAQRGSAAATIAGDRPLR
ncbi:MAG TPA: ABC transporter permease subunit [Acetobacteraceae bacterium]